MSKKVKCHKCEFEGTLTQVSEHIMETHGGGAAVLEYLAMDEEPPTKPDPAVAPTPMPEVPTVDWLKEAKEWAGKMGYTPGKADPTYKPPKKLLQHVCYDIINDNNIALTGHTGSGKTSLIYHLSEIFGTEIERVNTNQQTTTYDFVGYNTFIDGAVQWIDGALPRAMREGKWLLIDEVDYAEPSILSALNAVLEEGRELYLKENGGEVIKAAAGFRVFVTGNSLGQMAGFKHLYRGVNRMNGAFINRFPSIYMVDYLNSKTEASVIAARTGVDKGVAKNIATLLKHLRDAFIQGDISVPASTRTGLSLGAKLQAFDQASAIETVLLSRVPPEEVDTVKELVQRIFGGAA